MKTTFALIFALLTLALPARVKAAPIQVDIYGTVVQNNYVPTHPLGPVTVGSPAHTSFQVDSNNFINSSTFPVRGYSIVPGTFMTTLGSTPVALSPVTVPPRPFFSIRNDDPQVDGFLISHGVDFVNPTPTTYSSANFSFVCSYPKTMLNSVDIMNALGSYSMSGISLIEYDLEFGESIGVDISYNNMTIAAVPEPASLGLLALVGAPWAARWARRRPRCG
jgi:hypothetical protein